jgi:hypothetical protein
VSQGPQAPRAMQRSTECTRAPQQLHIQSQASPASPLHRWCSSSRGTNLHMLLAARPLCRRTHQPVQVAQHHHLMLGCWVDDEAMQWLQNLVLDLARDVAPPLLAGGRGCAAGAAPGVGGVAEEQPVGPVGLGDRRCGVICATNPSGAADGLSLDGDARCAMRDAPRHWEVLAALGAADACLGRAGTIRAPPATCCRQAVSPASAAPPRNGPGGRTPTPLDGTAPRSPSRRRALRRPTLPLPPDHAGPAPRRPRARQPCRRAETDLTPL